MKPYHNPNAFAGNKPLAGVPHSGLKLRPRRSILAFTMVEMLVVITVIGILVAILLPAVNEAIKAGEGSRAEMEIQSIKMAVDAFYRTYGKLPVPAADHGIADQYYQSSPSPSSKPIIKALIGEDAVLNPKKITFLELSSGDLDGTFLDSWGQQYGMKMDNNYDDEIVVTSLGSKTYQVRAVIRSLGADTVNGSPGDDLWSVNK